MRITASAPGKLVLIGEYAVLEGAPALVLAVDRRVSVVLTTLPDDTIDVVSPTLQLTAQLRIRHNGVAWSDAAPAELAWVATLLAPYARTNSLRACRVELDSGSLYVDGSEARRKLGLGSSAALCVALLGALHAAAGLPPPTLDACVRTYRTIQGGRGSGIDVAASLAGGLSRFRLERGVAHRAAAQLPAGLYWCCIYSGRPASTSAMLAAVAAWGEREPDAFARHTHELATIASRGDLAVVNDDAAAFLASLDDYARALARFGEAAGADIAGGAHHTIGGIAARCGCRYKSCGAGGGDVGAAIAVDANRLQDFAARATAAGFTVIGLEMDQQGLITSVAG